MIRGTDVQVVRRTQTATDEMGEPIFATTVETVHNVLWHPATTDEIDETVRMYGVSCEISLDFPKDYGQPLEGCSVRVDGREFRVLGDPLPYMAANTPTPWHRTVRAARADG